MFFGQGGGFPFGGMEDDEDFPGMMGGRGGPPKEVDNKALYETLECAKDATMDQIRKAYRKKAMKSHPDKGGDPEEVSASKFKCNQIFFELSSKKYKPHMMFCTTKIREKSTTNTAWTVSKVAEAVEAWTTFSACSWEEVEVAEPDQSKKLALSQSQDKLRSHLLISTMVRPWNLILRDRGSALLAMELEVQMRQLSRHVPPARVEA
jgi:hypothetical protein